MLKLSCRTGCPTVFLNFCVYLCDCLSAWLLVCVTVCLRDCLSVWLYFCLPVCVCMTVYLSACLCLCNCLSVWLFVCVTVCLFFCETVCVCLIICLSDCLPVWLLVCVTACLCECLSVWLFVCLIVVCLLFDCLGLSGYLSVWQFLNLTVDITVCLWLPDCLLSVCRPDYSFVWLFACLTVYLYNRTEYLSDSFSIRLIVDITVGLAVCLSVCLSVCFLHQTFSLKDIWII